MHKKLELLAPAGNMEKLKMAILYGADAVYFGGRAYGLRAFSDNFNLEEMREAVSFAHQHGARAYLAVNIFAHNSDLQGLPEYVSNVAETGIDAVICADPGVLRIVRQVAPDMEIHLSTQANNVNWSSALFWQGQGIKRIVMARELALEEIKEIADSADVEIEAFVHGAMCISYSGRCLISHYMTGRDANRGECTQPCRWKYALVEEKRPGQYYPIAEDERGTYIMNSKDLCMLGHVPDLIKAGITSFKIEGRMKSVHYVATVTKVYREALDAYLADPERFFIRPDWLEELDKVSHREYTTGFYLGKTTQDSQIYGSSSYDQTHDFVGIVTGYDAGKKVAKVEQRNNFSVGQEIEFAGPRRPNFTQTLETMLDQNFQPITVAPHPQQTVYIPVKSPVAPYDMLRRRVN